MCCTAVDGLFVTGRDSRGQAPWCKLWLRAMTEANSHEATAVVEVVPVAEAPAPVPGGF